MSVLVFCLGLICSYGVLSVVAGAVLLSMFGMGAQSEREHERKYELERRGAGSSVDPGV